MPERLAPTRSDLDLRRPEHLDPPARGAVEQVREQPLRGPVLHDHADRLAVLRIITIATPRIGSHLGKRRILQIHRAEPGEIPAIQDTNAQCSWQIATSTRQAQRQVVLRVMEQPEEERLMIAARYPRERRLVLAGAPVAVNRVT